MLNYSNFELEKYLPGGRNRYTCPRCGKKKCFTRYIDTLTQQYVDPSVGRCDHESHCGYHLSPREFFNSHPELNAKSSPKCIIPRKDFAPRQTLFFPMNWVMESTQRESTLSRFLLQYADDKQRMMKVLDDYRVGATIKDSSAKGVNYGPAAIFWQIDENDHVHEGKIMYYSDNGHRAGTPDWVRALCVRKKVGPQLEHTDKVLFGLHLLNRHPEKTIYVVESEKTALLAAYRYPHHLWLATGGCSYLTRATLDPIKHRKTVFFPDSGMYKKWSLTLQGCQLQHYRVEPFMEDFEANEDIADVLLNEAHRKTKASTQPKAPAAPIPYSQEVFHSFE